MSINSPIISAELNSGVYVIAFAPASIVSCIVSSVGPPVAIMGNVGYLLRIDLTIFAVCLPPETLNIVAPAFTLLSISSSSETIVTIKGISIVSLIFFIISFVALILIYGLDFSWSYQIENNIAEYLLYKNNISTYLAIGLVVLRFGFLAAMISASIVLAEIAVGKYKVIVV